MGGDWHLFFAELHRHDQGSFARWQRPLCRDLQEQPVKWAGRSVRLSLVLAFTSESRMQDSFTDFFEVETVVAQNGSTYSNFGQINFAAVVLTLQLSCSSCSSCQQ